MLTDVRPVELWATRLRRPSAAANPQGLAGRVPLAESDPWLEPIVDCGFDACRTSHSVAASERQHHNPSFLGHRARESGSTLYDGILQPLSVTVRPPGSGRARSQR